MHSSISISLASQYSPSIARSNHTVESTSINPSTHLNLRFCGLRRESLGFVHVKQSNIHRVQLTSRRHSKVVSASSVENGSSPSTFDYDLIIIGAGVGGHGAALHAVEKVNGCTQSVLLRVYSGKPSSVVSSSFSCSAVFVSVKNAIPRHYSYLRDLLK